MVDPNLPAADSVRGTLSPSLSPWSRTRCRHIAMQGPNPISARFMNRIKNSVMQLAGDPQIAENRELLHQIAAALEQRNNLFPFLNEYIGLLNQPTDPQLMMFLSITTPDTLQRILDTILDDPGSAIPGPGRGQGGQGGRQGQRGRGRAAPAGVGGGQPNLYAGYGIHRQTRSGFNRHVVRFQGMRDRVSPKQYYCILKNPMAFDRLLVPMQQELSVGVYAFRVQVNNIAPTDAVQWTLVDTSTFSYTGDVSLYRHGFLPQVENGWRKVCYDSSDVDDWIVVHYFNSNNPGISTMDDMMDNLCERFDSFSAADTGRLTAIVNSIP